MPKLHRIALPLLAAVALAGCTGAPPDEAETGSLDQVGRVTDIDALVDAYVAAGGMCTWQQTDEVPGAAASGTCVEAASCATTDEWSTLSVFSSTTARDRAADDVRAQPCETSVLVGENWIIDAHDAVDVAVPLGGRLYR